MVFFTKKRIQKRFLASLSHFNRKKVEFRQRTQAVFFLNYVWVFKVDCFIKRPTNHLPFLGYLVYIVYDD